MCVYAWAGLVDVFLRSGSGGGGGRPSTSQTKEVCQGGCNAGQVLLFLTLLLSSPPGSSYSHFWVVRCSFPLRKGSLWSVLQTTTQKYHLKVKLVYHFKNEC